MSSEFGKNIKINIFGQSHGEAVGAVIDGIPAGEKIDIPELMRFLDRRKGGKGPLVTKRAEDDRPHFLSGITDGMTCGAPICIIFENNDVHSEDYDRFKTTPRPGHADISAYYKFNGFADMRGGGHFSGRLTAPLCAAGGIAKQILARKGILVAAHILRAGNVEDDAFPTIPTAELFESLSDNAIPVLNPEAALLMSEEILKVSAEGDSIGGMIECAAIGVPPGLGGAMFGGIESRLSYALFGIPAVKAVEFGSGADAARMKGSENNDQFYVDDTGKILTASNNCGGILGGISNGMPLLYKVTVKPTPSISVTQNTVDLSSMKNTAIKAEGRHDPCIALRAVPVVEAVTAAVLLDILLGSN